MDPDHKYYHQIRNNPNFSNGPNELEFPIVESLKTTMERVIPFWTEVIAPQVRAGKRIMICTHGTTLRGLVKYLDSKYKIYYVEQFWLYYMLQLWHICRHSLVCKHLFCNYRWFLDFVVHDVSVN